MHTLHWWAVKAEDKEDAFGIVQNMLINDEGSFVEWSDWHVVGGGRWSNSQYEDSSDMVISYADTPDEFKTTLENCKNARIEEIKYLKDKINIETFTNKIETYEKNGTLGKDKFSLDNYYIKEACELMSEYYTPNSYFFDLIEYTADMSYLEEQLDSEDSKMLFLVPIDFHY